MQRFLSTGPFAPVYFPLGMVIFVIRLAVFMHAIVASTILLSFWNLKRFCLRTMCFVMGSVVRIKNEDLRRVGYTIVSNHITFFDHLILHIVQNCKTPHSHVFHWKSTCLAQPNGLSETRKTTVPFSIHLLPENAPSPSSQWVLRFDSSLFEKLDRVQPVALKASRLPSIKLVNYPLNWFVELFWQLFTPYTYYCVEYLAPLDRLHDETDADFAERTRAVIAKALEANLSTLDATRVALMSSAELENAFGSGSSSTQSVLPQVATCTEGRSKKSDVDSTDPSSDSTVRHRQAPFPTDSYDHLIPSLMDIFPNRTVQYVRKVLVQKEGDMNATIDAIIADETHPEQNRITVSPEVGDANTDLIAPSRLNMRAETFHSSSKDRQHNLLERRQALLDHARQRFSAC